MPKPIHPVVNDSKRAQSMEPSVILDSLSTMSKNMVSSSLIENVWPSGSGQDSLEWVRTGRRRERCSFIFYCLQ
eukprot:scaffold12431_cov94-Cyclotella_meneghiniana.AAC.7